MLPGLCSLTRICGFTLLLLPALGLFGCANGADDIATLPGVDASTPMRPDATGTDSGRMTADALGTIVLGGDASKPDHASKADAGAPDTSSGCGSNADCVKSPGIPVCVQGVCVACIDSTTCAAPTPKCDTTTNTCVACLAAGDCMPGFVCSANDTCNQGCSSTQPCPMGEVCNAGGCVQCAADTDCSGATPRCDTTNNTCVACLPTMDNCGTGQYCTGTTCAAGCKSSQDCTTAGDAGADPVCNVTTHACVQCLGDGDCSATQVCSPDNQCTTGCDTAHPCAAGESCCSGFCEALNTTSNCGACGVTCDTMSTHSLGASCNGTSCTYQGCASNYYDCNTAAPDSDGCETDLLTAGKKVCGDGVCVAVSSCCTAADCMAPPDPAACYATQGTCVEGSPCSYALNSGAAVCGTACCNALEGTCNANCTLNCNAGRTNCSGNTDTGCDTNDTTTTDCGGCRACSTSHTATAACTGGLCESTCESGWGNCSFPAAPSADDGCESDLTTCAGSPCCTTGVCDANHTDGIGQTYSDCTAFGVPGDAATYTRNMAIECLNADPITGGPNGAQDCPDPGGGMDDCLYNSCDTVASCPSGVTAECGVWCYTGGLAGHVNLTAGSATCTCPTTASPTWN